MYSQEAVVNNQVGLHARPAGMLNKEARKYKSAILVHRGDKSANVLRLMALMQLGVKCGVLEKSGGWLSYNGEKLGNGKDRVRGILCENPALCAELEAKIKECFVKKPDGFGDADAEGELSFSDELE